MGLTLNGASVESQVKRAAQKPLPVDPEAPDRVLLFMRLVALSLEAREGLRDVVRRKRTLERKLADPELASHPSRPRAERRLQDRQRDEHHATVRLIEANASLSRQWNTIRAEDKNRFALTALVGEPDPERDILQVLWADDRGLALLEPFPDDWTPAPDISHRVFDDQAGIETWTPHELLSQDVPGF